MDFTNRRQPAPCRAMTLLDVLFVIFVVLILAMILFPLLAASQKQSKRTWCVTNIKEIGIAYEIWPGENHEKTSFELSVTNGGTRGQSLAGNVTYTFQIMSNELSTPKILVCPSDVNHFFAPNLSVNFGASSISYFIGVDAKVSQPQSILTGDANLVVNGQVSPPGILNLATKTATWTKDRHNFSGVVGLADWSVLRSVRQNWVRYRHQF